MPPSPSAPVDPVLAEITKAIYGDVDVREFEAFAKFSPGSSDVHVDGPITPDQAKKQKKVAQVGLGATGVAAVGGLHALSASYNEHLHRMSAAGDEKAGAKLAARRAKGEARATQRVARVAGMKGPAGKVLRSIAANPRRAAIAAGTGWAGLHGVELVGDGLGMHAQTKAIQQANAAGATTSDKKPVAKALFNSDRVMGGLNDRMRDIHEATEKAEKAKRQLKIYRRAVIPATLGATAVGTIGIKAVIRHRAEKAGDKKKPVAKAFRLKPLNVVVDKVPSLRAKRPKLTPSPGNPKTKAGLYQPVTKGLRSGIKGARKTVREVKDTATHAEEATRKIKALIPSPRTAALAVGGSVLGLGAAAGAGSYAGSYAGTRAGAGQAKKKLVPVAVAVPARRPVAKSELDVTWTGAIAKVDADKRQVFGWASVSAINGEEIVDLQGDVVPIEEIEKAAYRYVIDSRKGGDMHRRVSKSGYQLDTDQPLHTADMIESFVVTPEKLAKMGLPANSLPHGWWCGFHVNDDAQWNMVKSGERKGFSIHGKGSRTPISKAVSLVRSPLAQVSRTQKHLQVGSNRYVAGDRNVPMPRLREARKKALVAAHDSGHTVDEMFDATGGSKAPYPLRSGRYKDIRLELGGERLRQQDLNAWKRGEGREGRVSKRERNRAMAPSVAGAPPKPAKRAKLIPLNVPMHSADKGVQRANKARLMLHRYAPQIHAATEGLLELAKADGPKLKERVHQAAHPPKVTLQRVKSTAVEAMGYQRQTRRLAVAMRSRPEQPYEYKMKPGSARAALHAPSKGHYFATEVRGKAKRAKGYSVADRARLFIDPQEKVTT